MTAPFPLSPSERLAALRPASVIEPTREFWIVESQGEITGYTSEAAAIDAIDRGHVVDVTGVYWFSLGENLPPRDVSEDIARAIMMRQLDDGELGQHTRNFLDEQIGWEAVMDAECGE